MGPRSKASPCFCATTHSIRRLTMPRSISSSWLSWLDHGRRFRHADANHRSLSGGSARSGFPTAGHQGLPALLRSASPLSAVGSTYVPKPHLTGLHWLPLPLNVVAALSGQSSSLNTPRLRIDSTNSHLAMCFAVSKFSTDRSFSRRTKFVNCWSGPHSYRQLVH
jgi:hypothetical protein